MDIKYNKHISYLLYFEKKCAIKTKTKRICKWFLKNNENKKDLWLKLKHNETVRQTKENNKKKIFSNTKKRRKKKKQMILLIFTSPFFLLFMH